MVPVARPQHFYKQVLVLFAFSGACYAEVIIDNSFNTGQTLALDRGGYAITEDLGHTAGRNLFHSFQSFNLASGETATFSAHSPIDNVIARVTGGNASRINGTIKNTIAGANTYLMNPAGILFGEQARLDVQGSFHATSADYLASADGMKFYAHIQNESAFSTAPISAFGFLDEVIAPLSYTGTHVQLEDQWQGEPQGLVVPEGQSLSLIGGDIDIRQGAFFRHPNHYYSFFGVSYAGNLNAPGGQVNLLAAAAPGEIYLSETRVDTTGIAQLGEVRVGEQASIQVSGEGAGSIFIRADRFVMESGHLEAQTLGANDGGRIDIRTRNDLLISGNLIVDNILNTDQSLIRMDTNGAGRGADLYLEAGRDLIFSDNVQIISGSARSAHWQAQNNNTLFNPVGYGDAGFITLKGQNIRSQFSERDFARSFFIVVMSSDIFSNAQGGSIQIEAQQTIDLQKLEIGLTGNASSNMKASGVGGSLSLLAPHLSLDECRIFMTSYGQGSSGHLAMEASHAITLRGTNIFVNTYGVKDAGHTVIKAPSISILEGTSITTKTFDAGDSGDIQIDASEALHIKGIAPTENLIWAGMQPIISTQSSASPGTHTGSAGDIVIQAGALVLADGAQINSSTEISVQEPADAMYLESSSSRSGQAGNIQITVDGTALLQGANPSGQTEEGFATKISSNSLGQGAGNGGNIVLQAQSLEIRDGAQIQTTTSSAARGGDIQLDIAESLVVSGDTSTLEWQPTQSRQFDYLANYQIDPHYNQATSGIYANTTSQHTQAGKGGNIYIHTPHVQLSEGALISSSSEGTGDAGTIEVIADQVQIDRRATLTSASQQTNYTQLPDIAARDALLIPGDTIEVENPGGGRVLYVYIQNQFLRIPPLMRRVAGMAELSALAQQYFLGTWQQGMLVSVEDDGSGQSAQFAFSHQSDGDAWMPVAPEPLVFDTLEAFEHFFASGFSGQFFSPLPVNHTTRVQVTDNGQGQAMHYVYTLWATNQALLLPQRYFQVSSVQDLNDFSQNHQMPPLAIVEVTAEGSQHVYYQQQWQALRRSHAVTYVTDMHQLPTAQQGQVVELADGTQSVFSGQEWLPVHRTFAVNNLNQRDQLAAQSGDIAKVTDTGEGRFDSFVYANNAWHRQIRGGEAGHITVQAKSLHLSSEGQISTAADSAGGGVINLYVDDMMRLDHASISSSVQNGVGGGGDLNINTTFLVQDQAPIIAQAVEGNGGNIQIQSKGIYQFGGTLQNPIDASSQFGLSGEVNVMAPDNNLAESTFVVSGGFLNTADLSPPNCNAPSTPVSHFSIKKAPSGTPSAPEDFLY